MRMEFDFSTFERPDRPNNWFVAPADFASKATPDATSPVFECPPDALFERIFAMIEACSDWKLRSSDVKQGRISFVATSKWLRFKDDIDILVQPVGDAAEKSTLVTYSRSRLGYSDFKANQKRVTALLAGLDMP